MTRSGSTSPFPTLDEAVLAGKRVLVRVDLNVPMANGRITDLTRIDRILANIREISEKGAKVIILSHLGRPKNGPEAETSLKSVAVALEHELNHMVFFASDCVGAGRQSRGRRDAQRRHSACLRIQGFIRARPRTIRPSSKRSPNSAIFMSTTPFRPPIARTPRPRASRINCRPTAGRTMQRELEMLTGMLADPERPMAAIVGGAKVSTKLELLGNLMRRVEYLFIGGGMANTFPVRKRQERRQVDLRDAARRNGAENHGGRRRRQLPARAADRRHRRHAVRSQRANPRCRRRPSSVKTT